MGYTASFQKANKLFQKLPPVEDAKIQMLLSDYFTHLKHNWEFDTSSEENKNNIDNLFNEVFNVTTSPEEWSSALEYNTTQQKLDFIVSSAGIKTEEDKNKFLSDHFGEEDYEKNLIGFFCSSGAYFDNDLSNMLLRVDEYTHVITRNDVGEILKYVYNKLFNDHKLEMVTIDKAFIEKEDPEDPESTITTYRKIDGVMASFGNDGPDVNRELYTSSQYDGESEVYASKEYLPEWNRLALENLLDVCIKMLTEVDWNNQIVMYSHGY